MPNRGPSDSLIDVPYHHNLNLRQIFDACRVCITSIEQSVRSESHVPTLSGRLDTIDEAFESVSTQFCADSLDVPNNALYLLLLILQKFYELLQHHVEVKRLVLSNVTEFPNAKGITLLNMMPHGQVHVSIEKLLEDLNVVDFEADRIEDFVYRLHRQITHRVNELNHLERVVRASELWKEQLVSLSWYTFRRDSGVSVNSVALTQISDLLDFRDLRYIGFIGRSFQSAKSTGC